jgi:hypothetical protein
LRASSDERAPIRGGFERAEKAKPILHEGWNLRERSQPLGLGEVDCERCDGCPFDWTEKTKPILTVCWEFRERSHFSMRGGVEKTKPIWESGGRLSGVKIRSQFWLGQALQV